MSRLDVEKKLLNLSFGQSIEQDIYRIERVASPFRDGPRFFIYRGGKRTHCGNGDPYHGLTEASACLA